MHLDVPLGTSRCNGRSRIFQQNWFSDVLPRLLRPGQSISASINWQRGSEPASVCWFIISAVERTSKKEPCRFSRKDCGHDLRPKHFLQGSLQRRSSPHSGNEPQPL